MSTMINRKHVTLTMQQRLDVLDKLERGVRLNTISKEYNISISTAQRIHKNASHIRQQSSEKKTRLFRRLRKPVLHELDGRLYSWYLERKVQGERVTDAILREKASQLNAEFEGPSSFTASKGWMWRFKVRHNIRFSKPGEFAGPDSETADEFAVRFLRLMKREGLRLDNIYSMDETSLLWKWLPQKMVSSFEDKALYGCKLKKERVTVGFCANATGTHKLMPLFVHKFQNPRALKHCRTQLPVVYKTHMYGRMTRNLFADWLENHFKPAVRMYHLEKGEPSGKVVLLVDTCLVHALPPELETKDKKFEIVLLPANAASVLPMIQGVIAKVKTSFRNRMLSKILTYPEGVSSFYQDYDIKDCIDFVTDSWAEVTEDDVRNSWKRLLSPAQVEEERDRSFQKNAMDAMTKTLSTIAGKQVSKKEVGEWLSTCEETEDLSQFDSDGEEDLAAAQQKEEEVVVKVEDEPEPKKNRLFLTEKETETLFEHLEIWVRTRPAYLHGYAAALKRYYDNENFIEAKSNGSEGG